MIPVSPIHPPPPRSEPNSLQTRGYIILIKNTFTLYRATWDDSFCIIRLILRVGQTHTAYKRACLVIWTWGNVDSQGRLLQDWVHPTLRPVFLRYLVGVWDQGGMWIFVIPYPVMWS